MRLDEARMPAGLSATPPVTTSGRAAFDKAKLEDGARQFEAMMLQEMLKPLHFGGSPDEADSEGGEAETIRGLGTEAVAKAIAKAGGFGLARQIIRQVGQEDQSKIRGSGGAAKV